MPGGQRELDRVRVAEGEDDHALALELGAIADADDVELLGPAGGDAGDGVEDQRASEAVEPGLRVVLTLDDQLAVLLDQRDALRDQRAHLALGAFDENGVAVDDVYLTPAKEARSASYQYETFQRSLRGLRVCWLNAAIPLQPGKT